MSNKSPIFSIAEPQHFSDHYVFHPQIDYFQQILEETRMQKIKEAARYSIDTLHFKLQKLISKDELPKKTKKHNHKKKWWKNALLFFKWNKRNLLTNNNIPSVILQVESEKVRVYANLTLASGGKQVVSDKRNPLTYGPVYITESRIGSGWPCRKTCPPSCSRLAGKWIPTKKSDLEIPYINLKEFNMDQHHWVSRTSVAPIYLVT